MVENSQPVASEPYNAVESDRQKLKTLSPGDSDYFVTLNNLSNNLMARFGRSRNSNDLEEGVERAKELLALAPPGHAFRLAALSNLGTALQTRFKFRRDVADLTQAICYLEASLESCTTQHPYYVALVTNLALCLRTRYLQDGDITNLNRIAEICSTALGACSSEDRYRDGLLNNFAAALQSRFEQLGDRADLNTAVTHFTACLELRPPGHPKRPLILGNLADTMHLKFDVDGDLEDLERAIGYYVAALQLCSPGQEGYTQLLTGLGTVFWLSCRTQDDDQKLETALNCFRAALASSKESNVDQSRLLDCYAAALQTRHAKFGDISDLDLAIQSFVTSLDMQHPSFPRRFITLLGLGLSLLRRFTTLGNPDDLNSSIECLSSSLQLCAPRHYEWVTILSACGNALLARYQDTGDLGDLDLALSKCRDALASCPPTHLNYGEVVGTFIAVLLERFRRLKDLGDLQTVIDRCDSTLVSLPRGRPAIPRIKEDRAYAFLARFWQEGDADDLRVAIDSFLEAIGAISEGHSQYVSTHQHFALALQSRFESTSNREDLEVAMQHYQMTSRVCKRGHASYVPLRMNLGNAFRLRFEYFDDLDALDEAIVCLAEVEGILSTAPGNPHYVNCIVNLGIAVFMRFQVQRNAADLNLAIEHLTRALALPSSHDAQIHFTLGTLLSVRYHESGSLNDLEQSIQYFNSAVSQIPTKHPIRMALLRNHGHALAKLAKHRDPIQNLDLAMLMYGESLALAPSEHYDQPLTVMQLAEALRQRAMHLRSDNDMDTATKLLQELIETLPQGHQLLPAIYQHSGSLAITKYDLIKEGRFLEEGFKHYAKAARYTDIRSFETLDSALQWASHAERLHHASALQAYQTSLNSLDHHVLSTPSVKHRQEALRSFYLGARTASLAANATACAIDEGRVELAVELSEQGRGLLWSQMARIRTPLDSLRSSDEDGQTLASELERISAQLGGSFVPASDRGVLRSRLSLEEDARQYRRLSKEWEEVVERIREKEGFRSFLRPTCFQDLQKAALGGPVILVNVAPRRCDAIIVVNNEPPRVVPLPNATVENIAAMSSDFYQTLQATSHVGEEKLREKQLAPILRRVWDAVVGPVVDELSKFLPRGSRIWWCPTSKLTALPLHAAGPYRRGANNLPNIYISSYTPTITALIRSRRQQAAYRHISHSFLAMGQSKPAESGSESELVAVGAELDLVKSLVPASMTFDRISGDDGTADAALEGLRTHPWVHLACHGNQDLAQPFDSYFAMRNGPLTLLDIVRANLQQPEFAFLSACHTAIGDKNTPDEVIHLAAGMQFSGFRSVIGTMWAVDDGMAQEMVKEFYKNMFAGDAHDCTAAAKALNRASKTVDKDAVPLDQRIVFIHIGA